MDVALLVDPGVLINIVLTWPSNLGDFVEFLHYELLVQDFWPVKIWDIAVRVVKAQSEQELV